MTARKITNYIWAIINVIAIAIESAAIWIISPNAKNVIKVLFILIAILVANVVFSKVRASIQVGKISIDTWPLSNLVITAIIVLSILVQYRYYYPMYIGRCEINDARAVLETNRAIVHGAGFIEDDQGNLYDYTNSLEALTNSYNMGNRIVELDFLWTVDAKMVCAHESETFARGIESEGPLTEEEFLATKSYGSFTTMNIAMLADFMREHPDLYVVTDFKYDLPESCEYISQVYPDLRERFIVQMYHYGQYDFIKGLGFNNIILTLYLTTDDERNIEELCEFVNGHDLVAITFWESYLDDAENWGSGKEFWSAVKGLNIPTCVHTVNDVEAIRHDFEQGVTAVYTDNVDNGWIKEY